MAADTADATPSNTPPTDPSAARDGERDAFASRLIRWSPIYNSAWDADPGQYVDAALVEWGRSRRLARIDAPDRAFKAYLGVQHFDPARWNQPGEAQSKFFLSLFVAGRTVALRTYPTLPKAWEALAAFYAQLPVVAP